MKIISDEQKELIDSLVAEGLAGDLSPFILEKDIHVTDALLALMKLAHEHVHFVFCGGTSLSKAHVLIERMSEDIDLKIVLSTNHDLTQNSLRNHLSKLKTAVKNTMSELGFEMVDKEDVARNSNHYFASGWNYQTKYAADSSLRAHLQLEFTVSLPSFDTVKKPIGYLTDQLSGRSGAVVEIACVAVEETLSEKVLSFLRRHAEHRAGISKDWDIALVRHVYDTYCIVRANPECVARAADRFKALVAFDQTEFRKNPAFIEDPKQCLMASLTTAETETQTELEYQRVLMPLIYGPTKPSFGEAFAVFKSTALRLLASL